MIELIHGDCLIEMQNIESGSVDMILTDPPYLISYKTNYRKNKQHDFCTEIHGDSDYSLIEKYIEDCYRVLKNDAAMYMFCSSKTIDFFKQEIEKYLKIKNIIVWVKNNWTAGDLKGQFGQQYEFLILAVKGKPKINGYRWSDVWEFNRVSGKNQLHQNQKPIDLLERCINSHCIENGVVFDGFMGSGSTGVACKNLSRSFIGIEKDENYFNIAKERINKQ
jgi:site-specific DNA-methyltransferase (adenine-specific)